MPTRTHGYIVVISTLLTAFLAACSGGGGGNSADSNRGPTANAGMDQTVGKAATVTLDASTSTDPNGDSLSYKWTQTSGTPVSLSSASAAKPTFIAPAQTEDLEFALVVNDGRLDSAADGVKISVTNSTPIAQAGGDLVVRIQSVVSLSGLSSSDPDGDSLTYQWIQISGPTVTLYNVAPGITQFTAPSSVTTLVFGLVVNDGTTSSVQDTISVQTALITVNRAPTAMAGNDQIVPKRTTVNLSGFGYDPEGVAVSYSWKQISGEAVALSNANIANPTFVAPSTPSVLVFELTTSDGVQSSAADSITITVNNVAPTLSVLLGPTTAYTNDLLTVIPTTVDADGDPITVSYVWQRNGITVSGQTGNSFPAAMTTKFDVIKVTVTASDGTVSKSVDASLSIADSPAILSATAVPTAVDYGDTVSFSVSATDADGDTIGAFTVFYGPAGFTISNGGVVTWLAKGAMFDRILDVNWGISLINQPQALLTGTIRVTDATRQYSLRRQGIEVPQNHNTMVVTDLDGDGVAEMLIAGSSSIQERGKQGTSYELKWVYPFDFSEGSGSPMAVVASDLNTDGKQEIFASAGNALIHLDGATRREATHRNFGSSKYCIAMEIGDLDGDGSKELVCLMSSSTYSYGASTWISVLDPSNLSTKWESSASTLGSSLAIGNVDGDAALEIVTASGYVYDGATHQNQWAYGLGFGFVVDTGDLDGDGVEEIVGGVDWSAARVYSATLKSPLWEITKSDIDEVRVADINSDGKAEILLGDGQWGNVTAYTYNTSTHVADIAFQINSQNHGVSCIGVGDIDGDSALEFVWGTGLSSSGADGLVVAGLNSSISIEWKSADSDQLDYGYFGGQLASLGAGNSGLLFGVPSTGSAYDGMRLISLNPLDGRIALSNEVASNWSRIGSMNVVDYDNDGISEIFLATANLYNGFLTAYDFTANTSEWSTSATNYGNTGAAVTSADINGDSYPDLASISTDGYIEIHDVKNSALIWRSTGLSGIGSDIVSADLDGDGIQEVIAATTNYLYVYGRSSLSAVFLQRYSYALQGSSSDILVADADGNGTPEIYVLSTSSTTIAVLNSQLQLTRSLNLGTTTYPTALGLEDFAFSRKNLLVGISGTTNSPPKLWAIDPISGADVWRSPSMISNLTKNSVFYVDTNSDGVKEISYATSSGIHVTR